MVAPQPRNAISSLISTPAPFWAAILFLSTLIIISSKDSNQCYCQRSPARAIAIAPTSRDQRLSASAAQSIQAFSRHQRKRGPQGAPPAAKRRRRADDILQFDGGHLAALGGRPLAQARAFALSASDQRQDQQAGQEVMPYTTFYVTQACDWKSNLFVPKSNDIHFAQQHQPADGRQPDQSSDEADSRTILSTSQKALVLALPISLGQSFAGYEPACSIRLIVPRNMRILAKLTSRRLTFEQEQLVPIQQPQPIQQQQQQPQAAYPVGAPASFGAEPNPSARGSQLWLNVSQNQFSETEQKVIETEGNVLAFRFLLERFAHKQVPEIRFQVVLTAFQTLAENSDYNQPANSIAWQPAPNQSSAPQQNAQFICDSQRLISANLACDGFKNCQDGHDEEPATCQAIRQQHQTAGTILNGPAAGNELPARNQQDGANVKPSESQQQRPWLARLFNYLTRDSSPFIGFLVGLLLFLLLLVCCACSCHCLLVVLRQLTWGRASGDDEEGGAGAASPLRSEAVRRLSSSSRRRRLRRRLAALRLLGVGVGGRERAELDESDSLARGQNIENAARLKARSLLGPEPDGPLAGESASQRQQQRIQSILKRPTTTMVREFKAAPLARFEVTPASRPGLDYAREQKQRQQQPPSPPPPRAPSRTHTTRADSSQQQTPSPRRGALASSLTSAVRSSGRFTGALTAASDFRPTPAARASTAGSYQPEAQSVANTPQLTASDDSRRLHQPQLQMPFHRSQESQARRAGPNVDDDDNLGLAASTGATGPSGEVPPQAVRESDRLKFKSKTTKLEQTSTVTGSERVTVYQYSTNLAQFSESYLMKQRIGESSSSSSHLHATSSSTTTTTTTRAAQPSGAANDQPPDLPPKTRQSSLI